MKNLMFFLLFLAFTLMACPVLAQFGEPEVQKKEEPRNLYDEGYRAGFGFNFTLNDFGFGTGGQFRFGLSPRTEAIINLKATGLKDPSEQTYVDFLGYRTIPEKFQRVLSVPLYAGLKQRLFASQISDNFRLYTSLSAGPVFGWSYEYFDDRNGNYFRENDRFLYNNYIEPVNDIFSGWKNSKTHWGGGGEFNVGIDFGSNFANLSSVQFGFTMNYFPDGIQILEPCRPNLDRIGQTPQTPCPAADVEYVTTSEGQAPLEKANGKRKYFGSAQISFVFGWMW